MSAFYDLASLVLVPSGYKSGKVYAQKPLTTDGQLTFTRASTATRVNASALVESVASGVPRLDYLNSSCPRLLLEPQRTNLAQYSEQADNAYWLKYQCSLTANQGVSPDGYTNADLLTMSANGIGVIYRNISTAGAVSCFMKANSLGSGNFYISVDGVGEATWNANGVKTNTPAAGTSYDGVSYGNGWYRFTYVVSSGSTINFGIAGATTGDSILLWGMQNEASSSYATSYIPTLGASVTRVGEECQTTSLQSASLIGATAGTFFVEANKTDDVIWFNQRIFLTSTTQRSLLMDTSAGQIRLRTWDAASAGATITTSGLVNGLVKYLVKWDGTNIKVFANGVLVGSSAQPSYAYTTYSAFESASFSNNEINQVLFFPTALSDTQCIELTA